MIFKFTKNAIDYEQYRDWLGRDDIDLTYFILMRKRQTKESLDK